MPIDRICRITGHRIFRDFSWPNELEDFKRYNLVYGWNGTGKSTLACLLRHLQRRAPVTEGTITIRANGVDLGGDRFDTFLEPIRVFNSEFVEENVFTSDNRLAPIFVIGKENIEKQELLNNARLAFRQAQQDVVAKREALQKAVKEKDDFCINQARLIKEALGAHGNAHANYNKRNFRTKIEALIESNSVASSILDDHQKDQLIAQARMAPKPRIPEVGYAVPDLASLSEEVAKILSRKVTSRVIDSLKFDSRVAEWVHQGLPLHSQSDRCRFCDQPIPFGRLEQLNAHFSQEFAQLIDDINGLSNTLEQLMSTARSFEPTRKVEFYDDLVSGYDKLISDAKAECTLIESELANLVTLLKQKKSAPFDEMASSVVIPKIDTRALSQIQQIVISHNCACAEFESRVADAVARLESGYVAVSAPEYQRLTQFETEASDSLNAVQATEGAKRGETVSLEREIISHRRPADELNYELEKYLGHSDLQLDVKETGYAITRNEKPASSLSEGERTAIAILYFLKTLTGQDFHKPDGIVVLDDPVSSLDANCLFNAFAYIKDHTKDAKQVILFTHNFGFFKAIREWFHNLRGADKKLKRFFMLSARIEMAGRSAYLAELDPLLRDYESEYHYLFASVYRLASAPAPERLDAYLSAPTIARRLLESFLSFRVPDESQLYTKMQAIPCDDTLRSRIYRFVNTHSHRDAIGDEDDNLSILTETKAVMQSVIDFMRSGDPEHCKRMISCVNNGEARA